MAREPHAGESMPKRIVLCCDGTNNQFGVTVTNVVRLIQALADAPDRQVVYYDPGIGTLPEIGALTRASKWASERLDLAFATGLAGKVERAYTYLIDTWEPGDDVYLFGFSRGAYTVRVLAGLLHTLGLLQPRAHNLVPYAVRMFGSAPQPPASFDAFVDLCDGFRGTFARAIPGRADRRFPVRFLGVWDTVSSVGWVWEPKSYPYTRVNPSVAVVRHAVAIDERRAFFRQNLCEAAKGQDVAQCWFAGVHSDVGGGYPEADGGLWRPPFEWMLDAARDAGLLVDDARRAAVLDRTPLRDPDWAGGMHESLRGAWWIAEYFPKLRYDAAAKRRRPHLARARCRTVPDGATIHDSALRRIRGLPYAPRGLSPEFLRAVREGPEPRGPVVYRRPAPAPLP